ncbi:SRPBCC family protein [Phenylobacterium sp.]|uniref:SRPBCC family protein n=1 Tax=Phenylobacterium sp. TaxID=1871053 RepID=UPI002735B3F0|nr:SRPBCC family protein [Phenylobacterium sp.]MDP3855190.1 SRPBCC family protein [Phenylobacterium sp.]
MADLTTAHETLIFERPFACSPEILYGAFADPVARARWGLPSPTATIIYDEADFRVGGRDRSRCGAKSDPRFLVDVTYLDIVPNHRIVYSEKVMDGDRALSAALHTIEISPRAAAALLKVTVQLAAFEGEDMAQGVRFGFNAALDNLAREIAA